MPDQAGWDRVEHLAQREAARGCDRHEDLLVIGGAHVRQRLQELAFGIDPGGVPPVARIYDLVDEAAIVGKVSEVAATSQQQRILHGSLDMAMGTLDRAVLVSNAPVVPRGLHSIMGTERVIAPGQVDPGIGFQIAEGGREAVGAMKLRRTACGPERVLQSFGQGNETLAAQNDVPMLEATAGQPEVIKQVIQWLSGNRDCQIIHACEIGQAEPSRFVHLPENDFAILPVHGAPVANAPLQGSPGAEHRLGISTPQFLEDRDRPQARSSLQHRHDHLIEDTGKRIRSASAARCLPL